MRKQDLHCLCRAEHIYADMLLQIAFAEVETGLLGNCVDAGVVEQVVDLRHFP